MIGETVKVVVKGGLHVAKFIRVMFRFDMCVLYDKVLYVVSKTG